MTIHLAKYSDIPSAMTITPPRIDPRIVRIERLPTDIASYRVLVGDFTLDITATDKRRCEKIAEKLRRQLENAIL